MRYAFFGSDGRIETSHNDDTVVQIPVGAIELNEAQWASRFDLLLVDGLITVDPVVPPIQAIIEKMSRSIKSERDRRQLDGGVNVGQHWYLSTERATSEYNTIITTTRGLPDTTIIRAGWRTMDDSEVDMTPALALQILTAGIAHRCAIDDAWKTHKSALEAAVDPAAYNFSGGWPKVFGEK